CQQSEVISSSERFTTVTYKEDAVSINLLAAQLGLSIDESNSSYIRLKNSANTVLIFTHTGGQFFVNGREIGPAGEVYQLDGTTYVPQSLIGQIRTVMRSGGTYRPSTPGRVSGTVVIDAGHGGDDPGAISVRGFYEKTVNLKVAKKAVAKLRQRGLNVIMTRRNDRFVELERRAEIANQHRADLFVSIHADSCLNRSVKGFSVYVARNASYESVAAAKAIAKRMANVSPDGNGIKRADFRVLVKTKMPAVLVEMGYISNHGEAHLIASDSFQNQVAQAICDGICDIIERI
ncbi:MAG: N-acetylmuramoyl-L-alanine amidase, partial [Phycisphaerales bacterium]